MHILGQEIDVFNPGENTSSPYTELVFAKGLDDKGFYQKLLIEVYKNSSLDISRVRYDRWARVDGTVDRYYPMGYDSKIKHKGELPQEMKRAFVVLALSKNSDFYEFFEE